MLHSRYNPKAEAEKYVASLTLRTDARFFILIEPGLGYIIPFLREKRPDVKIIALHVEEQGNAPMLDESAPPAWNPACKESLQNFLEGEISDTPAWSIQVIEWRPALAQYGERYLNLLAETVDFIKRSDANNRTYRSLGKRWFHNFFKNLRLIKICSFPPITPFNIPIVVTGAGPSLESAIPDIKRQRASLFVLAASSSVPALIERGVWPDLIISTDGGTWAQFHLHECLRRGRLSTYGYVSNNINGSHRDSSYKAIDHLLSFAVSMNAALPSQCVEHPLLLMIDGSFWQQLVFRSLGLPFMSLCQRGTVTATALDLAFSLTRKEVVISGTDLAIDDIRMHTTPYAFERLLEEGATRFSPLYSQYFTRALATTEGKSHDIYAAWFKSHIAEWPKRFYTLGSNSRSFNAVPVWGGGAHSYAEGSASRSFRNINLPQSDLVSEAVVVLLGALGNETVRKELTALLFPDSGSFTAVSLADLEAEIRETAARYAMP
jgi:hypothetical protein